jgi:hypothetical protein
MVFLKGWSKMIVTTQNLTEKVFKLEAWQQDAINIAIAALRKKELLEGFLPSQVVLNCPYCDSTDAEECDLPEIFRESVRFVKVHGEGNTRAVVTCFNWSALDPAQFENATWTPHSLTIWQPQYEDTFGDTISTLGAAALAQLEQEVGLPRRVVTQKLEGVWQVLTFSFRGTEIHLGKTPRNSKGSMQSSVFGFKNFDGMVRSGQKAELLRMRYYADMNLRFLQVTR